MTLIEPSRFKTLMTKVEGHYLKDGRKHSGARHTMPGGGLHTGAKHTDGSKKIYHYAELPSAASKKKARRRSNAK
jgi:hypothetical protein